MVFLQRTGAITLLVWMALSVGVTRSEAVEEDDGESRLASWHWQSESVSVELVQRLPDQTRAFFQGRGFDAEAADAIALGCVFQTIFRNTSPRGDPATVEYQMGDWRASTPSGSRPPRLQEVWDREWEALGVSRSARIAFRWSLLPTHQRFEAGDYNWGMTSFGLPPGSRFDLELVWRRNGRRGTGRLEDVECPPDVHL